MNNTQFKISHERGYFDQLVEAFIRPPRQTYDVSKLGPTTFMVNRLMIHREDFVVQSRKEQLKLQCSLFSPVYLKDKKRPCIIYLHGNSSSRLESVCYAHMFAQEGFSLINFDLGGCGNSEGQYISLGWFERQDLQAVLNHVKLKYPNLGPIGLWGRSMGAVTALMCASENQDINVLVLDTPFCNLKQLCIDIGNQFHVPTIGTRFAFYMARKKIRNLVNYDPKLLNTVDYVKKLDLKVSALFLRASNDRMVAQHHVDTLYQLFKGEKYISIFQGDHNSNRPSEIYQTIVRFFVNRLAIKQEVSTTTKGTTRKRKKSNESEVNFNDIDDEMPHKHEHDKYITQIHKPKQDADSDEQPDVDEEDHEIPQFKEILNKK